MSAYLLGHSKPLKWFAKSSNCDGLQWPSIPLHKNALKRQAHWIWLLVLRRTFCIEVFLDMQDNTEQLLLYILHAMMRGKTLSPYITDIKRTGIFQLYGGYPFPSHLRAVPAVCCDKKSIHLLHLYAEIQRDFMEGMNSTLEMKVASPHCHSPWGRVNPEQKCCDGMSHSDSLRRQSLWSSLYFCSSASCCVNTIRVLLNVMK